jgi:hypothetical protein
MFKIIVLLKTNICRIDFKKKFITLKVTLIAPLTEQDIFSGVVIPAMIFSGLVTW